MHEFTTATKILDNILDFAGLQDLSEISRIRVEIGDKMGIEEHHLQFCFDSIKQLTSLRHARLAIDFVPGDTCLITGIQLRDPKNENALQPPAYDQNHTHHECNALSDTVTFELP